LSLFQLASFTLDYGVRGGFRREFSDRDDHPQESIETAKNKNRVNTE